MNYPVFYILCDRMEYHDMDYVKTGPQDYEQIMKEYPKYTATIQPAFLQLIKRQTVNIWPAVKAVVWPSFETVDLTALQNQRR